MATIVEKVRWMVGDRPDRSRQTDSPAANVEQTLTLPSGHTDKFPTPGVVIEWEDGEQAEVTAVASTTITVRAYGETDTISEHSAGAAFFIEPRLSYTQIADQLQDVIDGDLWPHIWVPKETTLTVVGGDDTYAAPVNDIESVVYAYQLVSDQRLSLPVHFMSPELSGNTDFPNGMISLPYVHDISTAYIAYRAKPTLSNMPERQLRLAALGAAAHLMLLEEAMHVGPSSSATERRIQDGSKIRAGAALLERFNTRRMEERIALLEDEQKGSRLSENVAL